MVSSNFKLFRPISQNHFFCVLRLLERNGLINIIKTVRNETFSCILLSLAQKMWVRVGNVMLANMAEDNALRVLFDFIDSGLNLLYASYEHGCQGCQKEDILAIA